MTLDHREKHLERIRSGVTNVIFPLQYLVDLPVSGSNWLGENLTSRSKLIEENEHLRIQQTLLQSQLQKFSAIEAENARLRELLQSSKRVGENVLIGEILAVDLDPFNRQVVINKGSNSSVYDGQPVLDAFGVMGQIIHVGSFSSTAMLITDPNHAIPVEVNRNGFRAIALGTGATGYLDLPNIPKHADVIEGDLLVTTGLGGRFPPGYPVGKVIQNNKETARTYSIVTAQPTAQLDRTREVLLVWQETNEPLPPKFIDFKHDLVPEIPVKQQEQDPLP